MLNCLWRHSLSIVLATISVTLGVAAYLSDRDSYAYDLFGGMRDDAWGALLIVIATKYFMEIGSSQSR